MASPSPSSKALTRKADMDLMPPPPPAKRIKRPPKVLDEDTYTEALSEIIARDFFPGLLETKHQEEYLAALDSHNATWIAEAGRKLTEVMTTPHRRRGVDLVTPTPRAFRLSSTPHTGDLSNPMAPPEPEKKAPYEKHLSLDAFQAKYTSEDNASFNEILDHQNQKRRDNHAFLWNGNKIPGFLQKAEQKRIKAQEEAKARGEDQKSIAWVDDRKAMPNTWKYEPRNGLMFTPDDSPPPPPPPKDGKDLPPKGITHANTRMPPPPILAPASPSFSAVRDAIAGNPRPLPSEISFGASETPRVNGYSFVADAPSPSPSELGAPPLTWGSIASLSSLSSDPSSNAAPAPSPFKLAATPRRELLHHKMVDKVAKNKRVSNPLLSAAKTPGATPKMTPGAAAKGERFGTPARTPAGQRLWSSLVRRKEGIFDAAGGTGQKGGGNGGRGFRWTPTPMARGGEGAK
ncbi:hypothetical protein RUND412_000124 [Rhizina undulata]